MKSKNRLQASPKTLQIQIIESADSPKYNLGAKSATCIRTYVGPYATVKAAKALFEIGADATMTGWKIQRCSLTKLTGGIGRLKVTYLVNLHKGAGAILIALIKANGLNVKASKHHLKG